MHHRIRLATTCLHISALLYLGLALFVPLCGGRAGIEGQPVAAAIVVFSLLMTIGIEYVVASLHRRRYWAWIASLFIFTVYVPSLFFPLGALGLWGLLDRGSLAEFGITLDKKAAGRIDEPQS
jgi:chromate transport protein ChrA